MSKVIHVQDLEPGDVLLYRGKGFVSRAIQFFDGSFLSHAALYLGNGQVGEAVARGLVEQDCQISFHGSEWVKAYRLRNRPADVEPVLQVARKYLAQGNRYGYEQLVLLALLCTTRKLEMRPTLRRLLRTLLDAATVLLADMLRAGKEPMICSEFVYRTYDEADPAVVDAYSIHIPGMLPLPQERAIGEVVPDAEQRGVHPQSLAALSAASTSHRSMEEPGEADRASRALGEPIEQAELDALLAAYLQEAESGQPAEATSDLEDVDPRELQAATDRFVVNFYMATQPGEEARAMERAMDAEAARSDAYQYLFQAAPDFVTPADLYATESLVLLGSMEIS